jgi:DNA invertase Pin-like site-specific DNA recombinase
MAKGGFIAYLRVSTDRQGASGLGLDAQREAVRTYLNGGDWHIIGEFVEVESGRNSDRPVLAQALAAARLHRVPLIVAKVDRLTRSLAFLTRLIEAGVDVRFCDLPKIEGPTGRFMLQQMAAVAELEAGMIAKRTRDALAAAKARGQKLGGRRPGQRLTADMRAAGRAAVLDRSKARAKELAPVIAELRAAGVTSLGGIAKALAARSIPTARGGTAWAEVQVARVLSRLDAAS